MGNTSEKGEIPRGRITLPSSPYISEGKLPFPSSTHPALLPQTTNFTSSSAAHLLLARKPLGDFCKQQKSRAAFPQAPRSNLQGHSIRYARLQRKGLWQVPQAAIQGWPKILEALHSCTTHCEPFVQLAWKKYSCKGEFTCVATQVPISWGNGSWEIKLVCGSRKIVNLACSDKQLFLSLNTTFSMHWCLSLCSDPQPYLVILFVTVF